MTCREKLKLKYEDKLDSSLPGGCFGCPGDYGFLDNPKACCGGTDEKECAACWDREIPWDEDLIDQVTENLAEKYDIPGVEDFGEDVVDKFNSIPNSNPIPANDVRKILDSGNRRQFESGAVRDIQEGKGRCDLLPLDVVAEYWKLKYLAQQISDDSHSIYDIFHYISEFMDTGDIKHLCCALYVDFPYIESASMFLEVSKHFEEGAKKYGENNWRKGIPVHCYIDSAVRHLLKYIRGDNDEPHDRAFCWNIMCAIWTCKHHPELNEYRKENCDEKTS